MKFKWVCDSCGAYQFGLAVNSSEVEGEGPPCTSCKGKTRAEFNNIPNIPNPSSTPPKKEHILETQDRPILEAVSKGVKYDQTKPRWDLLPIRETEEVVHVLTLGSVKYADGNWKKVDNARSRYFAALMRHITAWWTGETFDPETKRHHLAHAICCCMFLMWFDMEKGK